MYRPCLFLAILATLQPASLLAETSEQVREFIARDTNYKNQLEFFCVISERLNNPPRSEVQNLACDVFNEEVRKSNVERSDKNVCSRINDTQFYSRELNNRVELTLPDCRRILKLSNSKARVKVVSDISNNQNNRDSSNSESCTDREYVDWYSAQASIFQFESTKLERLSMLMLYQQGKAKNLKILSSWSGYEGLEKMSCNESRTKGELGYYLLAARMASRCELFDISKTIISSMSVYPKVSILTAWRTGDISDGTAVSLALSVARKYVLSLFNKNSDGMISGPCKLAGEYNNLRSQEEYKIASELGCVWIGPGDLIRCK
jgi:hypothetical protein